MGTNRTVLGLLAHPDDAEQFCSGTLALLHKRGWDIHIATMTPGDGGSAEYSREEISRIRKAEATSSVKMLDGTYHCLECDDVFIMYDRPTLLKVIGLLRKVRPAVVFAPSPSDYFVDHEMTSKLVWTACFACGIPNIEVEGLEPFGPAPHLYYVDAVKGIDKLGNEIKPSILVDITSTIAVKEKMVSCHESQKNWLLKHHDKDYVASMTEFTEQRGRQINVGSAEGFRQHLGDAFPRDNILKSVLGDLVHEK